MPVALDDRERELLSGSAGNGAALAMRPDRAEVWITQAGEVTVG